VSNLEIVNLDKTLFILGKGSGLLPGLTRLNLSRNYFVGGIDRIGDFQNLVELDLSANQFQGPLPRSVGQLTKLESLNLTGNFFSGVVPIEIGNLTKLTLLSLAANRFSGQLPDEIGNLAELLELLLSRNDFPGPIPVSFRKLKNLQKLGASENALLLLHFLHLPGTILLEPLCRFDLVVLCDFHVTHRHPDFRDARGSSAES
jgi:Leucine-rich repeat (LRR) protein